MEGKLEGKTMNMIVDTGSNISIVAPQLLRNIGKDLSCVQPVPNCLKSVTGEKLNLLGAVTLKFEIGNREILQSFYVADISESCILGLDFLQQQRCQLNITNGILSMGNVQVPLLHPLTDDLDMLCYRVIALEDINIQPHTEAVVPAKVVDYTGKSRWGIIEPADEESIPGVLIGKVLTKLTNETTVVPIRMVNVTEEKRKVVVVMDYFSKWPEAYALPNQEAKTVATVIVNEFVCRFGVPLELHSDQGTNFESAVFQEMCSLLGINKTRTTPLHPESDGMVERYNRTLKTQLSLFVAEHQKDWDKYVPLLLMAYRTATHASTHFTPD